MTPHTVGRSRGRRLAMLAACAFAAVCFAGCGGSSEAPLRSTYVDQLPPPEEPLVMTTGEVGTYGGRFVIGTSTSPETFNPITARTTPSLDITNKLFVRLTRFDLDTQQETPGLATSWDIAPDGKSVTFHLRHGAFFSDGQPITADDVVFTFGAIFNPTVTTLARDALLMNGQPVTVTAVDAHTVLVSAPEPRGSLLSSAGSVAILPKHALTAALQQGRFNSTYAVSTPPEELVTSGPFRVKAYRGNDRTVLARNPFWFGVDAAGQRLPYLEELVFSGLA